MLFVCMGVGIIVSTMAVVMGTPFAFYLKRDEKWLKSSRKNPEVWFAL